jgi:hypothetical protein
MAFNGSGVFARLYNWATDAANAIDIEAARMDAEMDGFATGLSNTITRDGQSTITADIPFNGNKITGLADPSSDQDAATRAYVLSQSALGPDLVAIEALTSAADKLPYATGTNTWAMADFTAGARAASALTYAADKMVYWTAAGTAATTTVTTLARGLLDDGNTTSMRTTLGLGTVATLDTGTDSGDVPVRTTDGLVASAIPMAIFVEQETSGTDGGTFTSGAWRDRGLNTTVYNGITGCSLAGGVVTLPAGTYLVEAWASAFEVTNHQCRLYNNTTALPETVGSTERTSANTMTRSVLVDRIVCSGTEDLVLQHWCDLTNTTDGFGVAMPGTGTNNKYAMLKIMRIA